LTCCMQGGRTCASGATDGVCRAGVCVPPPPAS
jgi:hypothetical protein